MLAGTVDHGDSLGNSGSLGAGDVQWMTAGSGIMHQEMPKGDPQRPHARLPALGQPARVAEDDGAALSGRDVATTIPEVTDDDGTRVRVVCGEFWGKTGPVDGVAADPRYLDISVPPGVREAPAGRDDASRVRVRVRRLGHVPRRVRSLAACRPKWSARRATTVRSAVGNRSLVLFDSGDEIVVQAGDEGIRFLLVSGQPIEEPVAWYGPIVMNTEEQLQQAYSELRAGTFIKHR